MWRHVVPMPTSTEPNQWAVVLMQRARKTRHRPVFPVKEMRLNPLKLWPQSNHFYNPLMIMMIKIMIIYSYEFCRMKRTRQKLNYTEKDFTFLNHKMLSGLLKGWTRTSEVRTRRHIAQLVKRFPVDDEGSLPCPQEPPLDPIWGWRIQSTVLTPYFKINFNIILPSTPRSL
jgi:hypothetical protein